MKKTDADKTHRRVVVIGGGVSGMAAALHAVEHFGGDAAASSDVLLVEGSSRLGGTIRTYRRDDFILEGGPDSFISEKPEALALARRLKFDHRLIETNPSHRRSFIVRSGKLRAVPEGFQLLAPSRFWPFVTSDIFSWRGKARMGLDLLVPRRLGANGDDDESLADFVRRRLGREALQRMAQPMVGGIYTADPEQLSLRATMPRFLEMERAHRSLLVSMWKARRKQSQVEARGTSSGPRYSLFLSFDAGMQVLVDELARRLPSDRVRLNARVTALRRDESTNEWLLTLADGERISAHSVCLALPAYAAGALLRDVDRQLSAELESIQYSSTATVNIALRRADVAHPLDGFGFVTPAVERRALLACSFSSVKFAERAPARHVLLRAFVGGALQPDMFALDDAAITDAVLKDLRDLLGLRNQPLFTHLERWPRSMAQYHVGHLTKIAGIRDRINVLPGLALAGNAYAGAGIPDCIRSGQQAIEKLRTQEFREAL